MELKLENVGIIKSAQLEFIQGLNLIIGASSSGKSTLLRAIKSMVDNSFVDTNISYGKKKMSISMTYQNHTATYERDLDNSTRKSCYIIDDQVYTKLGRTSLDDFTSLFKLAPVEIDGEKINFNFSTQFSGPFILLGSQSLLYSILTYRSSFDITKINDLYFSDLKKVKQEISVLEKTRESLDKERDQKENELKKLESFPSVYIKVQQLKQQYDELQRKRSIYLNYKNTEKQIVQKQLLLSKVNLAIIKFDGYSKRIDILKVLTKYNKDLVNKMNLCFKVKKLENIISLIESVLPISEQVSLIRRYILIKHKIENYSNILYLVNIKSYKVVESLGKYISIVKEIKKESDIIEGLNSQINGISDKINSVEVCPLCNQPICHH